MNQPQKYESASISVFSNMAAYRAGFEDDEDSCICRVWTRRNIAAFIVNFHCATKCSLPEENDEIPGKLNQKMPSTFQKQS